jgi:hypothetical protein
MRAGTMCGKSSMAGADPRASARSFDPARPDLRVGVKIIVKSYDHANSFCVYQPQNQ